MKIEIRKMSAAQKFSAVTFKPSSLNEESRTVQLVWTTGAKGLRSAGFGNFYEELSLDPSHVDLSRLNDGSQPLLAAHDDKDLDSVIGVVERAWIEGDKALANVRFAKDEFSERVFQKIKDGILRNVSVGYTVQEYTEVDSDNESTPTLLATRWTPAELSIVPIGFDKDAKIRNQTITDEIEVVFKTDANVVKGPVQMKDENDQIEVKENPKVLAERTRAEEIRTIVRNAGFEENLADDLIKRGAKVQEAKDSVALFEKYSDREQSARIDNTVRVDIGSSNESARRSGLEDALLHRCNPSAFPVTDKGREFYGKSVIRQLELMVPRRSMESDIAYATRTMSSSDFPLALANIVERTAQKRYESANRSYEQWIKRDTLRNYKEASVVRAGEFPSLLERLENGEHQNGAFGEQQEKVQLSDYSRIIAFSSQMIVNDDLKILKTVSEETGVAQARLENNKVYSALTTNRTMGDGTALYHANHGNLGTAGAISVTTVSEAFKLMRKQLGVDKLSPLNLSPKFLICGPDSELVARQFLATINPTQTSNVNPYSGMLELVVDASITGNQYYFASADVPTVVLYNLEGQPGPKIETRIHFETSALQMKIEYACEAQSMDWRGLVKNAGA